jgi:uncharacterized tellurite resistance protein B-like protein
MAGWLEKLRNLVTAPAIGPTAGLTTGSAAPAGTDEAIALGVLLWSVAEADGRLLDAEKAQIAEGLSRHGGVAAADLALVLTAVEQAAKERIDLYSFAREAADGLTPAARVEIVKQLYRVACADGTLEHAEVETIRLIAGLLRVPHEGFIAAKLAVKDELSMGRAT